MDKILIVDSDESFLAGLKSDLEKLQQFKVLTSTDGKQALSVLEKNRIAILATDIQTRDLDILELLSYMSRRHPNTPCIIMSNWGKPWYRKGHKQQAFLYHLEKPFTIGAMASAIFVGLNMRDEGTNFRGMTMTSLLPLLDLEQKTCRMQVTSEEGKGYLYFDKGVLIDAHYNDLNGEAAACKIAAWNRIAFLFSELPRHRHRKRVKKKVMEIADASWEKVNTPASPDNGTAAPDIPNVITLVDEVSQFRKVESDSGGNLDDVLQAVKDIEGYIAGAITESSGHILKIDGNLHIMDLQSVAKKMQSLFADTIKKSRKVFAEEAEALTVHSRDCIFHVQPLHDDQLLVGVFGINCNANDLKRRLDSLSMPVV